MSSSYTSQNDNLSLASSRSSGLKEEWNSKINVAEMGGVSQAPSSYCESSYKRAPNPKFKKPNVPLSSRMVGMPQLNVPLNPDVEKESMKLPRSPNIAPTKATTQAIEPKTTYTNFFNLFFFVVTFMFTFDLGFETINAGYPTRALVLEQYMVGQPKWTVHMFFILLYKQLSYDLKF